METAFAQTVKTAWQKSKWIIKGCIIGCLALILMIPMLYVKDIIREREQRQREAAAEISSKWAGPQNIIGPVIGIPFWKSTGGDTSARKNVYKQIAWFLPERLDITASVNPREKHRGIFKVMLYDAKIRLAGLFDELPLEKLGIRPDQVIWNEAFVKIDVADSRGLNDPLLLSWRDSLIELAPQTDGAEGGMTGRLPVSSPDELKKANFGITIDLNGSEQLLFTPVGKTTTVRMESAWKHPSFSGNTLPVRTDIGDTGFTASWKSMAHTRNFPQQWIDQAFDFRHLFPATGHQAGGTVRDPAVPASFAHSLSAAAFGTDLFIPVNGYQKTMRTIKYALLCILLTFAAFFLIETSQKKSVHPFHYGLVGLALVLFYTLLLSFTEYFGFNSAYAVAAVATIGLIGWFVKGILGSAGATTILLVVLVLIYSYVFSLLQLQDYSLLLGSIGLFLSLGVVMHFSRKLQW